MNVLESFEKARAAAQQKLSKQTTNRKFSGQNELQLCGRGQGMYFGAFILDSEGRPLRIIDGYRYFRIGREAAEKYGITNFELRLCDPSNYINPTPEQLKLVTKLNKMVEEIERNWDAWQGKIALYPPRWIKHMTIQYMKVVRKSNSQGVDDSSFKAGVKVIMSRSDAYFKAFDEFIVSQNTITGGMDFVNNMVARDIRNRPSSYMVKSSLPEGAKTYSFSFQEIQRPIEITDEDLRSAMNLNTEVVDITEGAINVEELSKWNKLFTETYSEIKNEVYSETVDPVENDVPLVPPVVTEEVKAPKVEATVEKKVEPVKVEEPLPIPGLEEDDIDPFVD